MKERFPGLMIRYRYNKEALTSAEVTGLGARALIRNKNTHGEVGCREACSQGRPGLAL